MSLTQSILQLSHKYPDSVVFIEDNKALSYRALVESAMVIANTLTEQSVGARIAVYLPRGNDAASALYGVLWAGRSYIPLDEKSTTKRLLYILTNSGVDCLIGKGPRPDWLPPMSYIDITNLSGDHNQFIEPAVVEPESLAAILYTSGSTGVPKGVAVSHRSISAFVDWGQQTFSLSSSDRIASLTPFHFDLSLFDIFTGPLAGASTWFISDVMKFSPSKLSRWIADNAITCWYTVPSILKFITLKGNLENTPLASLRLVLFAGEVFPVETLSKLCNLLPAVHFYNLFGPTETNVCCYWPVRRETLTVGVPIPIGRAACEAQLKIDCESGELLVKGPCLMSGYWNGTEPELPLSRNGWFSTGDKVSFNQFGELNYHGRLDRMMKVSGYRVEPAEIESALTALQGVESAAVVSVADKVTGERIVAVISGSRLELKKIRGSIGKVLPAYMLPSHYEIVDTMPVLSNGKLDYQLLKQQLNTDA